MILHFIYYLLISFLLVLIPCETSQIWYQTKGFKSIQHVREINLQAHKILSSKDYFSKHFILDYKDDKNEVYHIEYKDDESIIELGIFQPKFNTSELVFYFMLNQEQKDLFSF